MPSALKIKPANDNSVRTANFFFERAMLRSKHLWAIDRTLSYKVGFEA